jgi:hypothetical protein
LREHVYYYPCLVRGSTLNSLLYCYKTDTPILIEDCSSPFYFDEVKGDFSFLGYEGDSVRTVELWNRLYMMLSLAGLIINPLPTQNIRIDKGSIVCITQGNKRINITTDKVLKFEKEQKECMVYDWFAVKSGGQHNFEKLKDPENFFVQLLRFHPSLRKNVRNVKDVVAFSKIKKEEITDFNYSEGIARLKVIKMMKEAGIRGKSNGVSKKGYKLHYAIKLEHTHREIIPKMKHRMSLKKILELEQVKGKTWNLTKSLFTQKTLSI